MKNLKIIVLCTLFVSLVSNYILLTKLDVMDDKINNIANYQNQVISTVNSQVSSMNNTINKIQEEQSWLSSVNVETKFDETDKNRAVVSFEWQVKELQNNSEVFFNYKKGSDKEYTSIKAESKGNSSFSVTVPVEINLEPNWNCQIFDRSGNVSENSMKIEETKEAYEREKSLNFNYYISVSHSDLVKSSEISIAYIEDVGAHYYGYLEVHTDIDRDRKYSLSVISGKMYDTSIYLKQAYIKKYIDSKLIEEEKLMEENLIFENGTPAKEDSGIFRTKSSEEKIDFSSLVLKVVYSDGAVFEREIYSK